MLRLPQCMYPSGQELSGSLWWESYRAGKTAPLHQLQHLASQSPRHQVPVNKSVKITQPETSNQPSALPTKTLFIAFCSSNHHFLAIHIPFLSGLVMCMFLSQWPSSMLPFSNQTALLFGLILTSGRQISDPVIPAGQSGSSTSHNVVHFHGYLRLTDHAASGQMVHNTVPQG